MYYHYSVQMLYLIGSNSTQTKFRTLKIDRTEPEKLVIIDDKVWLAGQHRWQGVISCSR